MKLDLTLGRRYVLFALGFVALLFVLFILSYYSKKSELKESFNKELNEKIEYLVSDLQEKFLKNSSQAIEETLVLALNTLPVKSLSIKYKNLTFSKENLVKNSNYPFHGDWDINEVSVDASYGYLVLQSNNIYRFFNTALVNPQEPLKLKFVLSKDNRVLNTVSTLKFYYVISKDTATNQEANELSNSVQAGRVLYFIDEPFADLEYIIDEKALEAKLKTLSKEYFLSALFVVLLGALFAFLIYFLFIKKMFVEPILAFKLSMTDALENNFMHKIEETVGKNKDIDESLGLLNKILRKYIGVVNELNINKGILERKVFTDDLTGLPNQKVFELDLKNMFIVGSDGFVGSIKLEALGNFTKEFGAALANHLIEEFTHVVQNKFYEINLQEATLYRFFGSEFAMILKNEPENKVLEFSQSLQLELKELETRYEIKSTLVNFSFVPFDKYGTIDSILHAASGAYNKAKTDENGFYLVSPSEVLDKFQALEQNVREIIETGSFEVTYGFDTRTTDESNRLIMKEAMPILYDKNREKFSIGVFISVAEKINLAVQFDKSIIEEVVKYLRNNEVEYEIAINLSMFSLKDSEFVNWLHSLFLYNKNIAKHLVFSMTSYNASTNLDSFKLFIEEIHRFGSKIILKRFSSNDFTVEQLEELNLDYLRISKDYTSAIAKDRDKKHFLRTIVNFGQSHDIIIIGDTIKDEKDIEMCTTIGLDAISSY